MDSLAVFCGSSSGSHPSHVQIARELGEQLGWHGITLVYGGGRVGLMGHLADGALSAGGKVVGVIPKSLFEKEIGHTGLSELIVTNTMHERKFIMADRASAFIGLPGGFGTLDELFEILTWAQLGIHTKPVGLLNINGFFDKLLNWLSQVVLSEGFIKQQHLQNLIVVSDSVKQLLQRLSAAVPENSNASNSSQTDFR